MSNIDFTGCAWHAHNVEREKAEAKCEQLLTLAAHAWHLGLKAEKVIFAKYKALHDTLYPREEAVIPVNDENWTPELEPVSI